MLKSTSNIGLQLKKAFLCSKRLSSTYSEQTIVLTDDGRTYVAWHPKQDFPYEYTRPLPEEHIQQSTTVLKTQMTPELKQIFNKKSPEQSRLELMTVTNTTKHRWFPRARDKKAKKTSMDRTYL